MIIFTSDKCCMAHDPSARGGIEISHLPKSNFVNEFASHCQLSASIKLCNSLIFFSSSSSSFSRMLDFFKTQLKVWHFSDSFNQSHHLFRKIPKKLSCQLDRKSSKKCPIHSLNCCFIGQSSQSDVFWGIIFQTKMDKKKCRGGRVGTRKFYCSF